MISRGCVGEVSIDGLTLLGEVRQTMHLALFDLLLAVPILDTALRVKPLGMFAHERCAESDMIDHHVEKDAHAPCVGGLDELLQRWHAAEARVDDAQILDPVAMKGGVPVKRLAARLEHGGQQHGAHPETLEIVELRSHPLQVAAVPRPRVALVDRHVVAGIAVVESVDEYEVDEVGDSGGVWNGSHAGARWVGAVVRTGGAHRRPADAAESNTDEERHGADKSTLPRARERAGGQVPHDPRIHANHASAPQVVVKVERAGDGALLRRAAAARERPDGGASRGSACR